jgi:CheY-like chemotaxis protein
VLLKPAKLLIVDDNESIRISLSLIFSELGFLVRTGKDGSSGLAEIRNEIPDVLLSDLNMVRIPGLEFLRVVRNWLPSIRVIAMANIFTGDRVPPTVAADALLQKDASPVRLIVAVDAMTHPKRSTSRLSLEDSFGFQVLEAIPSHPGIERLRFPDRRTLPFPLSSKNESSENFPVQAADQPRAVGF